MDLLLTLSSYVLVLSLVTIFGFFITWLVGLIIKRKGPKTTGKIGMSITLVVLILSIAGAEVAIQHLDQEKQAQEQQINKQNNKFKNAASNFTSSYITAGSNLEDIGSNEYKSWGDKIDNSDSDFDVDVAVADIISENSTKISQGETDVDYLKSQLKIMEKNDSGKYGLSKYQTAYKNIKKFYNFVSYPTGSYNDFSTTMSELDDNVSESYDALN